MQRCGVIVNSLVFFHSNVRLPRLKVQFKAFANTVQSVLITRLKQEYFRIEIIDKNACRDEQEMRRMKEKGYVILFIFLTVPLPISMSRVCNGNATL